MTIVDRSVILSLVSRQRGGRYERGNQMQGVYVNGARPKSKKAVKEAVAAGGRVSLEGTSMMGNDYDGPVSEAPDGSYHFVGPDPYRARNFYGTITVKGGVAKVS